MNKPILVLQMQRMGDLIMTFPLLAALQKKYPHNPLWTVAEEAFFTELMPFAPKTTFFPPSALSRLQTTSFHTVINLSTKAAAFAGSLHAENYMGAHTYKNATYITGDWALYRASIVENNRYNLFHWADLQLLDHINGAKLPPIRTNNALRQEFTASRAAAKLPKVGIFVGASEAEKRPSPAFFAQVATALLRKQCQPLFLGGPNDAPLGHEAMRLCGIPKSSLCGAFTLTELAKVMADLALCITPDTGPMHLAAWTNTPILNISLGPVNPWETGPITEGHHIITPRLHCTGCWKACAKNHLCQNTLQAGQIALLAHTIIHRPQHIDKLDLSHMRVHKAGRQSNGLYDLIPLHKTQPSARHTLSRFWQTWFWQRLGNKDFNTKNTNIFNNLQEYHAPLYEVLYTSIRHMSATLTQYMKKRHLGHAHDLPKNFWYALPAPIRPFTGHMHLYLQNEEYSIQSLNKVLENIETLAQLFAE